MNKYHRLDNVIVRSINYEPRKLTIEGFLRRAKKILSKKSFSVSVTYYN